MTILPGLRGKACRTMTTGNDDVTLSGMRGVFFRISPNGEMSIGPAFHDDRATVELGEMLVDLFGKAYGSALLKAEAKALAAETLNRTLERRAQDAEARANTAERLAKRGMVDVLQQPNSKPTRSRWFAGKKSRDDEADKADKADKADE